MDTIEELRRAFLGEKVAEEEWFEKEKVLMKDVINITCASYNSSAVQGYDPDRVLNFLSKPIPEIKKELGYEMEELELRNLVYSLIPKVKKFGNFSRI